MWSRQVVLQTLIVICTLWLTADLEAGDKDGSRPIVKSSSLDEVCRAAGYVPIPMQRGKETDWWYVNISVNKIPMRFMVDSGSATSVLSSTAAERLGYKRPAKGESKQYIENGPVVVHHGSIWKPFEIEKYRIPVAHFEVADISQLDTTAIMDVGETFHGLLGATFLHAYSAVIDYPSGKLYLLDPVVKEKSLQGTWNCVRYDDGKQVKKGNDVAGTSLVIRQRAITLKGHGKDIDYQLWLDPSSAPKRMDWLSRKTDENGVNLAGNADVKPDNTRYDDEYVSLIYRLEGGKLTIAVPLETEARVRSVRPAKFTASKKSNTALIDYILTP